MSVQLPPQPFSMAIDVLIWKGILHGFARYSTNDVADDLQNALICAEMLIASLGHHFAFAPRDFSTAYPPLLGQLSSEQQISQSAGLSAMHGGASDADEGVEVERNGRRARGSVVDSLKRVADVRDVKRRVDENADFVNEFALGRWCLVWCRCLRLTPPEID